MTRTVPRTKVEVLTDAPLVERVIEIARAAGVTRYTLMPTVGGSGEHGVWSDDQVTGTGSKVLFTAITGADRADRLIDSLAPLLDSHGLLLMKSTVEVVRSSRF